MTKQVKIRSATREDYASILSLERENHVDNVPVEARVDGFLSAQMSEAQLHEIVSDLGVAVAYQEHSFLGFFCASRLNHWPSDSVYRRLVHSLIVDFKDDRVSDPETFCLFGPMCISSEARGAGVLPMLYNYALARVRGRIAAGAGFIAVENGRSVRAMAKLNWMPVGRFAWGGGEYYAMIQDIV